MDSMPIEFLAKDKKVNLRLSRKLRTELKKKCEKMGAENGGFIRAAIMQYLKNPELKSSQFDHHPHTESIVFRISSVLREEIAKASVKKKISAMQFMREAIEAAL